MVYVPDVVEPGESNSLAPLADVFRPTASLPRYSFSVSGYLAVATSAVNVLCESVNVPEEFI